MAKRGRNIRDLLRGMGRLGNRGGGRIIVGEGAKIKFGGRLVRPEDGTRYTVKSKGQRRQENRRRNQAAKLSRRRNR